MNYCPTAQFFYLIEKTEQKVVPKKILTKKMFFFLSEIIILWRTEEVGKITIKSIRTGFVKWTGSEISNDTIYYLRSF